MSTFFVCYYHIVWATKYRQATIIPQIEPLIFDAISSKSQTLKCKIHAINSAYDHVHVAVTIPPSRAIWEWARDIKGLSAYRVNQEFPERDDIFRWQKGYSVHTFGAKILPFIVAYIERQKEHHQNNTLEEYLEYIPDE